MKLKKKVMSLALVLVLCLGLCACASDAGVDASTAPSANSGGTGPVGGAPEVAPTPAQNDAFNPDYMEVTVAKNFSEGKALIKFEDKMARLVYMGFIDKTGALQAYSAAAKEVEYVDGYVYMTAGDALHVMDQELKSLSSYPKDAVKGYGGGYTVTIEQNTGFDATGYAARVLDASGTEVTSKVFSNDVYAEYEGQGVFAFLDRSAGNALGVYCASSGVWLDELSSGVGARGNWFTCNFTVDDTGASFDYFDASGTVKSAAFPEEYLPFEDGYLMAKEIYSAGGVNDTIVFCIIDGPELLYEYIVFNAKSGTFTKYQGAYGDRVYDFPLVSGDGCFAATVEGSDGQLYTLLLNESMEDQGEPILGTPKAIADGHLYASGNSERFVYDLQGNEVSRPERIPNASDDVRDGVYCSGTTYYDAEGTPLFEAVDYSTGHLVELPE